MVTLTEQAAEKSSPSRNCLDLYEELLTEEGTAKEASFNDLSGQYEKCQRQMKQLITKLKEMQSMNTSLQNENQCLKKNISALIKTARVEITRKEDEINRLNRRFGAPGKNHSFKPNPVPLSINKSKSNNDDLPKNISTESLAKNPINLQSKSLCDKEKTCIESSQRCASINPVAKQCKESTACRSQEETLGPLCLEVNAKNRKEIHMDSWNKETERNRTKEKPKASSANSVNKSYDLKEKACQSLIKCGKNEFSQENRKSKSEVGNESENHNSHSSSTKEKTQLKEVDYPKEKTKKNERSPHRRESRAYEKEKNTESRQRAAEKKEEPRTSKRTPFSTLKDDGSHKLLELSDGKRSIDAGRKDKRSSEYSDSKHGNKDLKPSNSENASRNKPYENKTERSDRDRRDEKKRPRDEQDSRPDRKDKGQKREKDLHQSSSKDKDLHSKVSEKNKKSKVDIIQKDLKRSFMETLHLTLSPAKKTSDDIQQVVSNASDIQCEVVGNRTNDSTQLCVIVKHADSLSPRKTDLRQSELVSIKDVTTKDLHVEDSKQESQSVSVVDMKACLNEQLPNSTVDDHSESLAKRSIESKPVVCSVLDTVSSKEMDTHNIVDVSDLIDLDSFIEIDRCSGSPTSENLNMSIPAIEIQDVSRILEQSGDAEKKATKLKSNITETPKGICESPDTDLVNVSTKGVASKHCFHDEGSIDLNFIRPIPKVLSPLKSPVRPKAHLHTLERTAKASVVSILYKEFQPETDTKSTCLSVSEELNKENCQPDNKSDFGCKIPAVMASDELEEGEILSEEEQICKQEILLISSPSQLAPDKVTGVTKSHSGQDSELLPLSKPDTLILPPEKSVTKRKAKIVTQPKLAVIPTSKQRKISADSCLDGILKIVTPSSIQDVLQMLRIIRKHIRKKYMKFKIQFSIKEFHRIIEAATLCFITLVRNLDWSSLCSSQERLQNKLCRHIEIRLNKIRKNGIVDRIFEQHLIDMKKRLWKFVEDQLDSLFDTIEAVILKLCDKAEVKGECNEQNENSASCTNTQKSDHVQNRKSKRMDKVRLASSGSGPCLRPLEFHSKARVSNTKTQNGNVTAVQKESVKALTGIGFNLENGDLSSSYVSPTSKFLVLAPAKTSAPNEPCHKSQQNSLGLSFNLVSDDHMGDIFKSLLNDSDNLTLETMPESMWILGTPEKTVSSQKFDDVDSMAENKTPTKPDFSWSFISPPHVQTFPMFKTVLNPDVFDENCMLEIPTSASSSRTLNGSEDRLKSYSSILLEDLAVSLTVPSPLKSDSHLSFLRPICDAESQSEIDVKYCEGSVLDEEDATEQDIHLTLDSDNSSIGSLEDSGETGSFQCHPSEPMQAVIMEKSNDHFIVKIRRAVSCSSPVSDCSSVGADNAAPESLETLAGNKLEKETKLDTQSAAHNSSILLHPDYLNLAKVPENSVSDEKSPERDQLTVSENESVFKLPRSRSHDLEIPAEIKLTSDTVEHSEIDCEKNVTNCIDETCIPIPSSEILPMESFDANTVDLNLKKKKRESLDDKQSAKRQKLVSPDQYKGTKHNKIEDLHLVSSKKKHKRAVSEGAVNFHSSKVSPSSLSAKNVVKKKGEVVVSWTRDEDRAILLDCQKLGPTKKTFIYLSSTMNKYPHQVEERFRQLMKLFKKSKNSSS
ncbi:CASP8-associated protein 2 isoform X2 [Rhinoderma darwinii]